MRQYNIDNWSKIKQNMMYSSLDHKNLNKGFTIRPYTSIQGGFRPKHRRNGKLCRSMNFQPQKVLDERISAELGKVGKKLGGVTIDFLADSDKPLMPAAYYRRPISVADNGKKTLVPNTNSTRTRLMRHEQNEHQFSEVQLKESLSSISKTQLPF